MSKKGIKKVLKGEFVRCKECNMYQELKEARKSGEISHWADFLCKKCTADGDLVDIQHRTQNQDNVTMIYNDKDETICTQVKGVKNGSRGDSLFYLNKARDIEVDSLIFYLSGDLQQSTEFEGVRQINRKRENETNISQNMGMAQCNNKVTRKACIIGDSTIREARNTFCENDRVHRTSMCLPGGKLKDFYNGIEKEIKNEPQYVILHIGTNDLQQSLSDIKMDFMKIFDLFLDRPNIRLTVSAILPRKWRGDHRGMLEKLIKVNFWLEGICAALGFDFISLFQNFAVNSWMLAWDGLHPNKKGGRCLGEEFDCKVRSLQKEEHGYYLNY